MENRYEGSIRLFLMPLAAGLLSACPTVVSAACDTSSDPVVIAADCEDLSVSGLKSDVTIAPSVTVSPFFAPYNAVQITGQITGTFRNQGTITSGFGKNSLVNSGVVATLINEGLLVNGTLSTQQAALLNTNRIDTLRNSGTISATTGTFGSGAHAILQSGSIGTLENTGTISAQNSAIYFDAGLTTRIDTLINSGRIEGGLNGGPTFTFASAIEVNVGGSIGTIINTGVIDHSVCDPSTCYAAIANHGGSIGTIYNFGDLTSGNTADTAFGIINRVSGTIGSLVNDQTDLKYYGTLPQSYTAIVYGATNYGKLAVTDASGVLSFGVEAAAPLGTSSYASVLAGVTQSNLATTSGIWGGGMFDNTWELDPVSATEWDLHLTSVAIQPSVETGSGTAIADAIQKTVTENITTELPPGVIEPTLQNGVTLQQAAQSLTLGQVGQLSGVSSEGYSSNLTIGLKLMERISDSVTGHGSGQLFASANADPQDTTAATRRNIWLDTAVSTGKVSGYDRLSGFGYNLQSVTVGADIFQGNTGAMGVFAGLSHSAMTDSDVVVQNFNSTYFVAGLYGNYEIWTDTRVSASLGYLQGRNNASRLNSDIGQFTGGLAASSFRSEGFFGAVKLSKTLDLHNGGYVRPFFGLSYAQLGMSQTTESGGGDFNYQIDQATSRSAIVSLGTEFSLPMPQTSQVNLVGFANIGYDTFADDAASHTVTSTSHLFGTFDQVGADMGPVSGTIGIGIEGQVARGLSGRIAAVGSLNRNGYQIGLGGALQW
jgi:hypothetical protein